MVRHFLTLLATSAPVLAWAADPIDLTRSETSDEPYSSARVSYVDGQYVADRSSGTTHVIERHDGRAVEYTAQGIGWNPPWLAVQVPGDMVGQTRPEISTTSPNGSVDPLGATSPGGSLAASGSVGSYGTGPSTKTAATPSAGFVRISEGREVAVADAETDLQHAAAHLVKASGRMQAVPGVDNAVNLKGAQVPLQQPLNRRTDPGQQPQFGPTPPRSPNAVPPPVRTPSR